MLCDVNIVFLVKIKFWKAQLGDELVVDEAAIPTPYDFTFFALPGNESSPIHLLSPLVADTIDETIFWVPSISTPIAGDTVYSHTMHLWLADLLSPALTEGWLSTIDFIEHLKPQRIIPGHSLSPENVDPAIDLNHCRSYIEFFQREIEAQGPDFFTPGEIFDKFNTAFPGLLDLTSSQTSNSLLNITAEEFGSGDTRQMHGIDLASFNDP